MPKKEKPKVTPEVCASHDKDKYDIEVDLPGVAKKDVNVGVTATGFCVTAPREEFEFSGCYALAHEIDPDKARAKFNNGLLALTLPFKESPRGKILTVE